MADLAAIRTALGDAIATLPAPLTVQRVPGAQVHPPCVIVEPGEIDWRTAMQRGHDKVQMLVRILIGTAFTESAHRQRDEFFGGVRDIKDAIESHVPLRDGTVAQDVFVASARQFDAWTYQGTAYLGVEVQVDVYA